MRRNDQYKLFTEYFGDYYAYKKEKPDQRTKRHMKKDKAQKSARPRAKKSKSRKGA